MILICIWQQQPNSLLRQALHNVNCISNLVCFLTESISNSVPHICIVGLRNTIVPLFRASICYLLLVYRKRQCGMPHTTSSCPPPHSTIRAQMHHQDPPQMCNPVTHTTRVGCTCAILVATGNAPRRPASCAHMPLRTSDLKNIVTEFNPRN